MKAFGAFGAWRRRTGASLGRGLALLGLLVVLGTALGGCGATQAAEPSVVDAARSAAQGSSDPDTVGRWLLAELLAPGGDTKRARLARLRLGELGGRGIDASLARAIDADVHGRFPRAVDGYLEVLAELRDAAVEIGDLGRRGLQARVREGEDRTECHPPERRRYMLTGSTSTTRRSPFDRASTSVPFAIRASVRRPRTSAWRRRSCQR